MSENVAMTVVGDELTIKINLAYRGGASKSGKSIIVAGTGGFTSVPGDGGFKIGLNCIAPLPKAAP